MAQRNDEGCAQTAGVVVLCVVPAAFLYYALHYAAQFVSEHLQQILWTVVVLLTLVTIARIIIKLRDSRAAREYTEAQRRRQELAAQAEQERGRRFRENLDGLLSLSNRLLIDTNIWMAVDYHDGLRMLAGCAMIGGTSLVMLGPEFEEIVRLKASRDRGKAAAAREAMRLVAQLQAAKRLRIERMAEDHVVGAYFDRVAVRLVDHELRAGRTVTVITDDAELRIRLLGRAGDACNLLSVHHGDEFLLAGSVTEPFYRGFEKRQATDATDAGIAS